MQDRVSERFDLAGFCVRSPTPGQWNFGDLVGKSWAVYTKAENLNLSLVLASGGRMDLLLNLLHADLRGQKTAALGRHRGMARPCLGGLPQVLHWLSIVGSIDPLR